MKLVATTVSSLCFVLVFATAGTPKAPPEAETRKQKVLDLLRLTGAGNLGIQLMQGMMTQLKPTLPDVPEEWWKRFEASVDLNDINDLIIPIYTKHFTDGEIDAMLAFYRTPEGRAIIAKMPVVLQESMAAGKAWGEKLGGQIVRELKADGYAAPPGLR